MGNREKVLARYPHASAEKHNTGEWSVWHISHGERERFNRKHWPETFGRTLLGLGINETEAWADAAQKIAQRGC